MVYSTQLDEEPTIFMWTGVLYTAGVKQNLHLNIKREYKYVWYSIGFTILSCMNIECHLNWLGRAIMTAKRITMELKNVISNKKAKYNWIKNEWNISRTTLHQPSYNYLKKGLKMKNN